MHVYLKMPIFLKCLIASEIEIILPGRWLANMNGVSNSIGNNLENQLMIQVFPKYVSKN